MTAQALGQGGSGAAAYNRSKLFLLSVLALMTAGMVFSIRADIIPELKDKFFMPLDPANAAAMVGAVAGVAFLGFVVSVIIGSPLCDFLGMGRLLGLSCLLFIVGSLTTIFASSIAKGPSIYWVFWLGMLSVGIAHGLVEAVINPLIATIYADEKTHKLNVLHAWWPGGIMIGGLIAMGLQAMGLHYQVKLAVVLVPAVAFGIMLFGTKFPPTERVAARIPAGEMMKQVLNPLFIIFFLAMFLTASSELAPGQWVNDMLSKTVGMPGIVVLIYVSMLMLVMRFFAGPLAHRFSPVGLLWISCLLAGIGLVALSYAFNPVTAFLAATVWGIGVCYMWPTMLGVTSERFPRGGALLMGLMGGAGNLSVYLVLPKMGAIYDYYSGLKAQELFSTSVTALKGQVDQGVAGAAANMDKVFTASAPYAFRYVAILPAILLVVFGAVWLYDRSKGGYKAERLDTSEAGEPQKVAAP